MMHHDAGNDSAGRICLASIRSISRPSSWRKSSRASVWQRCLRRRHGSLRETAHPLPIRQLRSETVNRIAAGEVIERPASVVKELVENALDAGATEIEVVTAAGGLSLIRVTDNGGGMSAPDLALAVERHATSKLADDDLFNIATLGFRGEALPSIGSVAHLGVTSRPREATAAHEIIVDRGAKQAVRPAALNPGTRVEVRELFSATPARLKFLKSERAENMAISEVVKRLAMAIPTVAFTLTTGERTGLKLPAQPLGADGHLVRLGRIMGREFLDDALAIDIAREGVCVTGFAGLPTLHRPDPGQQFLFVNGRPVRDRLLIGAVRAAYGDLVPKGRYPLLALFRGAPPARGRRQRASEQGGGTLSRCRRRAQPGGGCAQGSAGGCRSSGHHGRRPAGHERPSPFGRPGVHAVCCGRLDNPRFLSQPCHSLSPAERSDAGLCRGLAGADRGLGCAECRWRRGCRAGCDRIARPPSGGCPRAVARDLHRGANPYVGRHRRPARRPRAPGLRTHQGRHGQRRRRAAGAPDSRNRGTRCRRGGRPCRGGRRPGEARPGLGVVRARAP